MPALEAVPNGKTLIEYHGDNCTFPAGLRTADEMAARTGVSPARLLELARAELIPHYRIDGGDPLFRVGEAKDWLARHLVQRYEGAELPFEFRVLRMAGEPRAPVPIALAEIRDLREIDMQHLAPAVYFLCAGENILYVGQSIGIGARIESHLRRADMRAVNRVFVLHVATTSLLKVEGAFIRHLKPPLNGSNGAALSEAEARKVAGRYLKSAHGK